MTPRVWLASVLSAGLLGACAPAPLPYHHSRFDYWAFRARVGLLPEPNYLPWITHREQLAGGMEALVACLRAVS